MGFTSPYRNKYQTGGLQHLFAAQIRAEVGEETFSSYFKFSIVRDPWDKAVSQYEYMQERSDLRDFIGMRTSDGFKRYLELIGKRAHVQWEPQHRFLYDERGTCLVDYVGRFERLEEDARRIFSRLGLQAQLPHVNASQREATRAYYDGESAAMVAQMYARDIELFGYSPQKL